MSRESGGTRRSFLPITALSGLFAFCQHQLPREQASHPVEDLDLEVHTPAGSTTVDEIRRPPPDTVKEQIRFKELDKEKTRR